LHCSAPERRESTPRSFALAASDSEAAGGSVISVEDVRAVLLDIDGVLTVSWKPLPGAVDAVRALRGAGLRLALLTNTTSRTRSWIAATLADAGFPVEPQDVLTAPAATAAHLAQHRPGSRCLLLSSGDVAEDMVGVQLVGSDPDVVVLGGAGPEFDYPALNDVFGHLQRGAELVAMHRNLFWRTDAGLQLDSGAFLVGLERAADVEAVVVGKPAPEFFAAALSHVDVPAGAAVMVGDDVEADVLGGQAVGMAGVLVRTGKFRPDAEDGVDGERPQHVVDSVVDLPALLGLP
jgi:HAD superfamily hydrolase (TIGR01458 family)